jgi:hypothetical protein
VTGYKAPTFTTSTISAGSSGSSGAAGSSTSGSAGASVGSGCDTHADNTSTRMNVNTKIFDKKVAFFIFYSSLIRIKRIVVDRFYVDMIF